VRTAQILRPGYFTVLDTASETENSL